MVYIEKTDGDDHKGIWFDEKCGEKLGEERTNESEQKA